MQYWLMNKNKKVLNFEMQNNTILKITELFAPQPSDCNWFKNREENQNIMRDSKKSSSLISVR